jgi:hypothetical protein
MGTYKRDVPIRSRLPSCPCSMIDLFGHECEISRSLGTGRQNEGWSAGMTALWRLRGSGGTVNRRAESHA